MSDEPQKKVDETWKEKVQEEKEQTEEAEQEKKEAEEEKQPRPPLPEASFASFIATLQLQTLVALGDMPNPATQKADPDLQQAKYLIDILGIIQDKTKGNLTDDEKTALDAVLYDVRMRFVNASSGQSSET